MQTLAIKMQLNREFPVKTQDQDISKQQNKHINVSNREKPLISTQKRLNRFYKTYNQSLGLA